MDFIPVRQNWKELDRCLKPSVLPPTPGIADLFVRLFVFYYFETGSQSVEVACPELAMLTRLASNTQGSGCLCLPGVGIKGKRRLVRCGSTYL